VAKTGKVVLGLLPFLSEEKTKKLCYKLSGIKEEQDSLRMETKKAVVKEYLSRYLPQISVPTLVVWGEHDQILLLRVGRELAENIPNAKHKVILGGSHSVHKEKPQEFNKIVNEFVEGLNS